MSACMCVLYPLEAFNNLCVTDEHICFERRHPNIVWHSCAKSTKHCKHLQQNLDTKQPEFQLDNLFTHICLLFTLTDIYSSSSRELSCQIQLLSPNKIQKPD
ncbi:hypothetical protein ATANTOWER_011319 [Ataeniobius toweri]|uniref:Uncharacterized protein n=1 Tax=Ataeniobius toweri TaxID=208326 RepID=A0ABU7AEI4_9TELE|nr:hypothetical protein [Ataeniobius toweri]